MPDARTTLATVEASIAAESPVARTTLVAVEVSTAMGPVVSRVTLVCLEVSVEPGVMLGFDAAERASADDRAVVLVHDHASVEVAEYAAANDHVSVGLLGHIALRSSERAAANDSVRVVDYEHTAIVASESALATDSAEVLTALRYGPDTVVAGEIRIPGRPVEYVSTRTLRHPTRIYRRSVISWGSLDRSIPIPAGFPRVSDLTLRLADTDGYYRRLFAQVGARAAEIVVRMGPVNGRVSHWPVVFRGRVDKVECPPGEVRPTATDSILRPFHERPPALITPSDFPALPEAMSDVFAPIPYGRVSTEETSGVGAIQCPLVNEEEGWYLVSRERIHSVRRVLTWSPGQEEFEVVPRRPDSFGLRRVYAGQPTGWWMEEQELDIRGETYRLQVIRFTSPLPDGTQVRADVWGIVDDDGEPIENVVDILEHYLRRWMGLDLSHEFFDVEGFAEARAVAETAGLTSPNIGHAIAQSSTHAENLARLLGSVDLDFFPDRFGRLSCKLTLEDPPDMPVLDDLKAILWDSFSEVQGEAESANRLRYRTGYTPSTGEWYDDDVYDNELDRELLGETRERELDLWYLANIETGGSVAARISGYLDSQARRLKWNLSAPRTVDVFDLADIVGIRHFEGLEADTGTYLDPPQPVKVAAIRIDLDSLVETVEGVTREPAPLLGGGPLEDVTVTTHTQAGPFQYGRQSNFFGVFRYQLLSPLPVGSSFLPPDNRKFLRAVHSRTWGRSWANVDGSAMENVIGSHTAWRGGRYLHVAAQEEATGRVSYSRFDMLSTSWDIDNMEVIPETAISPAYRSGEPISSTGYNDRVMRPFVDVVSTASGKVAVFYTQGVRAYDDGVSASWSNSVPGWYWFRQLHFKVFDPVAGAWSEQRRATGDVPGYETTVQTDLGGSVHLDPEDEGGIYVWWHPQAWIAGSGAARRHTVAVCRIAPSGFVSGVVKFCNTSILDQLRILATGFGLVKSRWDEAEDDWVFDVPVTGVNLNRSDWLKMYRARLPEYATELGSGIYGNHLIGRVSIAGVSYASQGSGRGSTRLFEVDSDVYRTWVYFSYSWETGAGRLRGGAIDTAVTSVGPWGDYQSLVFRRGGQMYAAGFPILRSSGRARHFEIWPDNAWPVTMTYAEWLEIYGG
jgi:hypothetical protein